MSDILKDNEFLASLDLDLLADLVEFHSHSQTDDSINIISLIDFHTQETLKKAS